MLWHHCSVISSEGEQPLPGNCFPVSAVGYQLIAALDKSLSSVQWRYCIRLENLDSEVVQLRERHWRIFSLSGTLETVRGRGVVGRVGTLQPLFFF